VDGQLAGRDYLLGGRFSVADGYLYTVTRWTAPLKLDISNLGNLNAFMARMAARPGVQQALKAEALPA
jgi:glutathione S-transferase